MWRYLHENRTFRHFRNCHYSYRNSYYFGPKNLPKLGTAIGKAVKNLREGLGGNKKVKEAEEVPVKEAKDSTPEEIEVEVIDKPEPTSAKPAPKATEETNNA